MTDNDDTVGFSFTRGTADTKNRLRLVGKPDDYEYQAPTLLFTYDHGASAADRWSFDDPNFNLAVRGLTSYTSLGNPRTFAAVTIAAEVAFYHNLSQHEQIPDAGLFMSDTDYGYMEAIKQIGNHLYACGDNGQVYKRDNAEFGKGNWSCLDKKFLDVMQKIKDGGDIITFAEIDGPDESDIYIPISNGIVAHWDGSSFSEIQTPASTNLAGLFVESKEKIWIGADGGTLLNGNHHDGFTTVVSSGYYNGTLFFGSTTMLNGILYMADVHERGVFQYDGKNLTRVVTGLNPEVTAIHTVTIAEGILWAVGLKDIARFDGKIWERIPFPGNKPVR